MRRPSSYVEELRVARVDEDPTPIILGNPQPYCCLDEKP
jgi:hypothetical protein